jgi:hypothetical protein
VIVVTLLAIGVSGGLSGLSSAGTAPTLPAVITESAGGKTFTMRRTTQAVLRLGHRWNWTQPRVRGTKAVVLTPVDYESDPGFKEWRIVRRRAGTSRITAYGRPNCGGCATRARSFSVKLTVTG